MPGGRPPLPPGTPGEIWTQEISPDRWKARARFRDRDGTTRSIARFGPTETKAKNRLKEALRDRQHAATHGGLTPNSTVADLAAEWLASDDVMALAANSRAAYAYAANNQIRPLLGALRLAELRPRDVNDALKKVRATAGPGAAKTTKSALSGMCALAVSYEAIDRNPMHDAIRIKGAGRKPAKRVLTLEDETALTDALRTHPAANTILDLPDLVEWMLGTGCRIGEALAARDGLNQDGEPLLDTDAGTWEVNATLVRITGAGLVIQERTKSDAGWRRLALPSQLVEMVKLRREQVRFRPDVPVLFPSPRAATLRDPRNTSRDWLEVRNELGWPWCHFHRFRATVASRLLASGLDPVKVADHMGHARPSMTLDHYAGRHVVSSEAARILER